MIWKKDESTIYHWFGYWLGVFLLAYIFQCYGYVYSLLIGLLGSLLFWFLKELIWDKLYRGHSFNLADVVGGYLFGWVFSQLWKTQKAV